MGYFRDYWDTNSPTTMVSPYGVDEEFVRNTNEEINQIHGDVSRLLQSMEGGGGFSMLQELPNEEINRLLQSMEGGDGFSMLQELPSVVGGAGSEMWDIMSQLVEGAEKFQKGYMDRHGVKAFQEEAIRDMASTADVVDRFHRERYLTEEEKHQLALDDIRRAAELETARRDPKSAAVHASGLDTDLNIADFQARREDVPAFSAFDAMKTDKDLQRESGKPAMPKGLRTQEDFDAINHLRRTGEWQSPITGKWYGKDEETGTYQALPVDPATGEPDHAVMRQEESQERVAKEVGIKQATMDQTLADILEGDESGWGRPEIDFTRWQMFDPKGYKAARLKAAEEGRTSPRLSEVPHSALIWPDDPVEGAGFKAGDDGRLQSLLRKRNKYMATGERHFKLTNKEKRELQRLEVKALDDDTLANVAAGFRGDGRNFLDDLGMFVFGDRSRGEDNILGRVLTGLFGKSSISP